MNADERTIGCPSCGNNRFEKRKVVVLNNDFNEVSEVTDYVCTNCEFQIKKGRVF